MIDNTEHKDISGDIATGCGCMLMCCIVVCMAIGAYLYSVNSRLCSIENRLITMQKETSTIASFVCECHHNATGNVTLYSEPMPASWCEIPVASGAALATDALPLN
jgi:hypothetical protein